MKMKPPDYFCIRNHQYVPCLVLGRGYGDYAHERRSAVQYYVSALDGGWADYVTTVLTAFEVAAESFQNRVTLPHLVFVATYHPVASSACCQSLVDDPRDFTLHQLELLSEYGYGAALRYRAQKELAARLDADKLRYTCPLCECDVRVGNHAILRAGWSWNEPPDDYCETEPDYSGEEISY